MGDGPLWRADGPLIFGRASSFRISATFTAFSSGSGKFDVVRTLLNGDSPASVRPAKGASL